MIKEKVICGLLLLITFKTNNLSGHKDIKPECNAEDGIDYWWNDIDLISDVKDAGRCCDLCLANSECNAWAMRKDTFECFLKTKADPDHKKFMSNRTSGTVTRNIILHLRSLLRDSATNAVQKRSIQEINENVRSIDVERAIVETTGQQSFRQTKKILKCIREGIASKYGVDKVTGETDSILVGDMVMTQTDAEALVYALTFLPSLCRELVSRKKRQVMKTTQLWPGGIIYYQFHDHVEQIDRIKIKNALLVIPAKVVTAPGCSDPVVSFVEMERATPRIIVTTNGPGCWSFVGKQREDQVLNLESSAGCVTNSIIQHEFIHALGVLHHHVRDDRDSHVTVSMENVDPKMLLQFELCPLCHSNHSSPYDYNSIMHYKTMAFSKNGERTIVPKQQSASIGQALHLSDHDGELLGDMYSCSQANNYNKTIVLNEICTGSYDIITDELLRCPTGQICAYKCPGERGEDQTCYKCFFCANGHCTPEPNPYYAGSPLASCGNNGSACGKYECCVGRDCVPSEYDMKCQSRCIGQCGTFGCCASYQNCEGWPQKCEDIPIASNHPGSYSSPPQSVIEFEDGIQPDRE